MSGLHLLCTRAKLCIDSAIERSMVAICSLSLTCSAIIIILLGLGQAILVVGTAKRGHVIFSECLNSVPLCSPQVEIDECMMQVCVCSLAILECKATQTLHESDVSKRCDLPVKMQSQSLMQFFVFATLQSWCRGINRRVPRRNM